MEIRLPLIVDDINYKLKDGMQTTEGVERYDFLTPDGHLYEIDLAPANAAVLEKAVTARDEALAQINAEYEEAIADYVKAGQRMAPGARRTIKGAKRAPAVKVASPVVHRPAPAVITTQAHGTMAAPVGYRALPKPLRVAVRGWGLHWADRMGWGVGGPVIKTAVVDAWKEAGSPTDAFSFSEFPPKGLPEPAPKAPRKGAKPASKALPPGAPETLFQAAE